MAYENNDFGKLLLPLVEKVVSAEGATLVGSYSLDSTGKDAADAAKAWPRTSPTRCS